MRKADTYIEKTQRTLIKINVIMGLAVCILGAWGVSSPVKAEEIIQITDNFAEIQDINMDVSDRVEAGLPAVVSINTNSAERTS